MKNWPWYGYVLFAALIFALAFFFYFKPQNAKLTALKAERIKVEGEVQNLKQKKRELDKIEADIIAMTAKLKTLEINIPRGRKRRTSCDRSKPWPTIPVSTSSASRRGPRSTRISTPSGPSPSRSPATTTTWACSSTA